MPMSLPGRSPAALPMIARLTTDRLLCPRPRVSSTSRKRSGGTAIAAAPVPATAVGTGRGRLAGVCERRAIAITVPPRATSAAASVIRVPAQSTRRPAGMQNVAPIIVAQKLSDANDTRSTPRSAMSGSATSPRPCVRPGSVAAMAAAASTASRRSTPVRRTSVGRRDIVQKSPGVSPPARVPTALQVAPSTESAVKRTDPSTMTRFTPPRCRLLAARNPTAV